MIIEPSCPHRGNQTLTRTGPSNRGQANSAGAPIELVALDEPYEDVISARREGEPSFSHVQDVADAIMAALARGVDLVVPVALFEQIRDEFPPELPSYIKIR